MLQFEVWHCSLIDLRTGSNLLVADMQGWDVFDALSPDEGQTDGSTMTVDHAVKDMDGSDHQEVTVS